MANEKEIKTKTSSKKIGIIISVIFIIFVLLWLMWLGGTFESGEKRITTRKSQATNIDRDFKYASAGESWIILDDDIAVTKEPKTTSNKEEFINNIVTILENGEKVEVIRTKTFYWKYCKVKGKYYGWILGDSVMNAKKIN